jgi:hypothetical protein
MLAGANTFEISDTQEDESEAALARRSDVTQLHWVENGWMEFSRSTGEKFHRALVDECHVPQIQNRVLPRCLQSEQLSELLDIVCFNPATEREDDSTIC